MEQPASDTVCVLRAHLRDESCNISIMAGNDDAETDEPFCWLRNRTSANESLSGRPLAIVAMEIVSVQANRTAERDRVMWSLQFQNRTSQQPAE